MSLEYQFISHNSSGMTGYEPLGQSMVRIAQVNVAAFTTLETTQGQTYGCFRQIPFESYLSEVASVGD
jgi:hypothetical protein